MLVIKDFATTTTASALTAEATSITVVDGSKFPSLAAGDYFYAVIQDFYDRRGVEVVKVLGVSGNELSVERGLDGTVGRAFSAGAYVELRLTARTFAEFIAQSGDAAGAAASLIAQHNASAVAHPVVSESITPAGDAAILDLASATVFRVTLNAHITQIVFTNASGEEGSTRHVTLILRQGTGVNLASWPENIRWAYGHLPVLSYEKDAEDYITLVRFGADAHWYGFLTGGWFHV